MTARPGPSAPAALLLCGLLAALLASGCVAARQNAAPDPRAGWPEVRGDGYAFSYDPARWEPIEESANPTYEYQFAHRSARMLGAVWVDRASFDPVKMEAFAVKNAERLTYNVRVSQSGVLENGPLKGRYVRLFGYKEGVEMVIEYTLYFAGAKAYVVMTLSVGGLTREMIDDMNVFPRGMKPQG